MLAHFCRSSFSSFSVSAAAVLAFWLAVFTTASFGDVDGSGGGSSSSALCQSSPASSRRSLHSESACCCCSVRLFRFTWRLLLTVSCLQTSKHRHTRKPPFSWSLNGSQFSHSQTHFFFSSLLSFLPSHDFSFVLLSSTVKQIQQLQLQLRKYAGWEISTVYYTNRQTESERERPGT